ncbi:MULTISPECIES: cytochrome c [unclassified Thioalkalivibrio]|uniref:c-type cytochrome n=1 Tax=unclassified Thioalkalivibrio TaxID=2621013 RepID=UPI000195A89C|nr:MULTISPECIES: c-type cytochrome [unclassified Thioalkalivibrio]ADC70557.1 cytochrome c class I [Thioalkalivibrio sp. K90mix]
MNHKLSALFAALSVSLLLPLSAAQAGDPQRGQEISQSCAACHQADGNSTNPEWPKLAGQHPKYTVKQLRDFKEGETRYDSLMAGEVADLDEQDMRDLAAYFAEQSITTETADEDVVERGERIYRGGIPSQNVAACIACHGPNGQGNPEAMFPKVAGQHATYSADQLYKFRDGERSNDAGRMMRNVVQRMSDEDIEAVSQYMAGLSSD